MLRGGSWNNNDNNCRVANRNNNKPNNRNNNNGFRILNTNQARVLFLMEMKESKIVQILSGSKRANIEKGIEPSTLKGKVLFPCCSPPIVYSVNLFRNELKRRRKVL